MLKINISKTGNGEELRKTLNSLESEGHISSEPSMKTTPELDMLINHPSRGHGKSFRVTCAGVYNSGKSYLLNALTDREHFQVGDGVFLLINILLPKAL